MVSRTLIGNSTVEVKSTG